jgi:hypothetical protein
MEAVYREANHSSNMREEKLLIHKCNSGTSYYIIRNCNNIVTRGTGTINRWEFHCGEAYWGVLFTLLTSAIIIKQKLPFCSGGHNTPAKGCNDPTGL